MDFNINKLHFKRLMLLYHSLCSKMVIRIWGKLILFSGKIIGSLIWIYDKLNYGKSTNACQCRFMGNTSRLLFTNENKSLADKNNCIAIIYSSSLQI